MKNEDRGTVTNIQLFFKMENQRIENQAKTIFGNAYSAVSLLYSLKLDSQGATATQYSTLYSIWVWVWVIYKI
jgi:hypothetical protein